MNKKEISYLTQSNMYIKRLETWTSLEWESYFKQYNIIDDNIKLKIKQILCWNKEYIEDNFEFLQEVWIINWIWPWYIGSFFRNLLTKSFKYVRYEWHDIEYWIFGTEKDRKRSDDWLLKYSLQEENLNIPQIMFIYFCYYSVRIWGKWSFSYINKQ